MSAATVGDQSTTGGVEYGVDHLEISLPLASPPTTQPPQAPPQAPQASQPPQPPQPRREYTGLSYLRLLAGGNLERHRFKNRVAISAVVNTLQQGFSDRTVSHLSFNGILMQGQVGDYAAELNTKTSGGTLPLITIHLMDEDNNDEGNAEQQLNLLFNADDNKIDPDTGIELLELVDTLNQQPPPQEEEPTETPPTPPTEARGPVVKPCASPSIMVLPTTTCTSMLRLAILFVVVAVVTAAQDRCNCTA